jgi:hypothetical protein
MTEQDENKDQDRRLAEEQDLGDEKGISFKKPEGEEKEELLEAPTPEAKKAEPTILEYYLISKGPAAFPKFVDSWCAYRKKELTKQETHTSFRSVLKTLMDLQKDQDTAKRAFEQELITIEMSEDLLDYCLDRIMSIM